MNANKCSLKMDFIRGKNRIKLYIYGKYADFRAFIYLFKLFYVLCLVQFLTGLCDCFIFSMCLSGKPVSVFVTLLLNFLGFYFGFFFLLVVFYLFHI